MNDELFILTALTEKELERFCLKISSHLPSRLVIHLIGEIGYGKSTFVRALFRALGIKGAIKSPTYTLFEQYELNEKRLLHADFYRLSSPEELEYLGFDELSEEANLVCVEWPEQGGKWLQTPDLRLSFSIVGEHERSLKVRAMSKAGASVIERLKMG